MRRMEVVPHGRKWCTEIPQQIRQHLAHGLRLARQLRQIVSVIDGPLAEALARMSNARAVLAHDRDRGRPDAHDEVEAGPPTRDPVEIPIQLAIANPAMNRVAMDAQVARQGALTRTLLQVVPQ